MAKVLIVDDSSSTATTFSGLLRLNGHATVVADCGRAGIARALGEVFDVILVDLRLPDMSGIDVVREVRSRGLLVPAVIMTAFPDLDSSFDAASAGATGYVDGLLLDGDLNTIVQQAISGEFPVRRPCQHDRPAYPRQLPTDARVHRIVRTIESDLPRRWTIAKVAVTVGLSESRIRHLFRSQIGMSISRFVSERRLQKLAHMIGTTSVSFSQLAALVGTTELRRTRKAFQLRFGMSPSQYRARFSRSVENVRRSQPEPPQT